MNTWKVILATVVIFVAGAVVGGLAVLYVPRVSVERARPGSSLPSEEPRGASNLPARGVSRPLPANSVPQILRGEFLLKLDREVRLTSDQHQRIEKIMGEGQEHARQLYERITPDLRRGFAETRERILEVLTAEQRAKFAELVKQHPREQRRQGHESKSSEPAPSPAAEPPRGP